MKNIVIIGGHDETFMHYNGLGFDFTVLQLPDSVGPNLKALTERIHLVDDFSPATVLATVREILESQTIDYIFSFTEDGLLPAALASRYYAIAGMDFDTCQLCIDKASMRSQLAGSEFAVVSSPCSKRSDIEQFFLSHPKGMVLKAPRGSGSENVYVIKNREALLNALQRIGAEPFDLLAEEFLEGREVSIETLTIDSRHRVLAVTNKRLYRTSLAEEQHIISPDNIDEKTFEKITRYCERLLTAINHRHGPCHIEVMISNEKLHLIEINNRVGGDFIGLLVELTTGVDLFRATLLFHSSIKSEPTSNIANRYTFAGSHLFYEPVAPDTINDLMQEVDIIRLIMDDTSPILDRPHINDDKVGLLVIASNDREKFYRAVSKLNELTSAN